MLKISISHSNPLVVIHGNAAQQPSSWMICPAIFTSSEKVRGFLSQSVMFDFSDSNHCSVVLLVSTIHYDSPLLPFTTKYSCVLLHHSPAFSPPSTLIDQSIDHHKKTAIGTSRSPRKWLVANCKAWNRPGRFQLSQGVGKITF